MSLNKAELGAIYRLLELAGEHFSNRGCNDHYLLDSPGNVEMLDKMNKWTKDPFAQIHLDEKKHALITQDWLLMEYLSFRCQEEYLS
jgi:hypothetical protein